MDLGCTDEARSIATIRSAIEHGINLIDTAARYGFFGRSEKSSQGAGEGNLRSQALIATRLDPRLGRRKHLRNASRPRILQEVDASLRALRTHHIAHLSGPTGGPSYRSPKPPAALRELLDRGKNWRNRSEQFSVEQMEAVFVKSHRSTCCNHPTICSNGA